MYNKIKISKLHKIIIAAMCIFVVVIAFSFSILKSDKHFGKEIVDFDGVGIVSANLNDFLSSDKVSIADKNVRYNISVQLQNECLFDYMAELGFDGEFSDFMSTDRARFEKHALENYQLQFVQALNNNGADVQLLSALQASQNCVYLSVRLADLWKFVDLQQVISISFKSTFYVPYGEEDDGMSLNSLSTYNDIALNQTAIQQFLNTQNGFNTLDSDGGFVNGKAIGDKNNIFLNDKKYNGESYKGEGRLVAVIDNGFYTGHSAFATAPTTPKYGAFDNVDYSGAVNNTYAKNGWSYRDSLIKGSGNSNFNTNDYAWVNSKIPFAFNYALKNDDVSPYSSSSHGTHVAGILAGNNGGDFKGVASEAQLMLCRASDNSGIMTDESIAVALEDCLIMGADVVNISLGSNAGLDDEVNNPVYIAIENLNSAGVSVAIAAGNEGTSAKKTENGNEKASSANPDNGMIGSPASYLNSLAVANFDGHSRGQIVADSSSRGVTNNLLLKPDISGFGTLINSSTINNYFGLMSGTSMSSPNVAGSLMAVTQYCQQLVESNPDNEKLASVEKKKIAQKLAIKLIMSTAEVASQSSGGAVSTSDVLYSPRSQGAGIANLDRAINSVAYLQTNDGGRPKLDGLANSRADGVYTFEFSVVNMSSNALSFDLNVAALTENIVDSFMSGLSRKLNPTVTMQVDLGSGFADDVVGNNKVNVAANEQTKIKIIMTLSGEDKALLDNKTIYPNGMYVDGYIQLTDNDTNRKNDLSIPFLGYYGNWTNAGDMLDATYYEVKSGAKTAQMRPSVLYGYYNGKKVVLGEYLYNLKAGEKVVVKEEKASISKDISAINALSYLELGLLRNSKAVVVELLDDSGSVVGDSIIYKENSKTSWNSNYKMLRGGGFDIQLYARNLEEGKEYKIKVSAYLTYDDNSNVGTGRGNIFESKFFVDSEAPKIKNAVYTYDGKKRTVALDVVDNRFTQMIAVCKGVKNNSTIDLYPYNIFPIDSSSANKTEHFEIDVTEWVGDISTSDIYFYTVDYAMNKQAYKLQKDALGNVVLVQADIGDLVYQNLVFSRDSIRLDIGETYNLSNMLMNGNGKIVTWSTSNPLIVTVNADGNVEGMSKGEATITAKINMGERATIKINVGKDDAVIEQPTEPKTPEQLFKEAVNALPNYEDLTVLDKDKIAEVRAIYDKLSEEEKSKVGFFYTKLQDAEAKIVDLEKGGSSGGGKNLVGMWIGVGVGVGAAIVIFGVLLGFVLRKRVE